MITVTLTQASYDRIVEELLSAKNAIEYSNGDDQPIDFVDDVEHELHEEWTEICTALRELGA